MRMKKRAAVSQEATVTLDVRVLSNRCAILFPGSDNETVYLLGLAT
jgi:hypothetical protein